MPKNRKLTLNSGIQTYQILTNDDEVSIPSISSILLAVLHLVLITLLVYANNMYCKQKSRQMINKQNQINRQKKSSVDKVGRVGSDRVVCDKLS